MTQRNSVSHDALGRKEEEQQHSCSGSTLAKKWVFRDPPAKSEGAPTEISHQRLCRLAMVVGVVEKEEVIL